MAKRHPELPVGMTICRHDKNGEVYLAFRVYGPDKQNGLAYFAFHHNTYERQYDVALSALRRLRDVEIHYDLPPLRKTLARLGVKKQRRVEYDFVTTDV